MANGTVDSLQRLALSAADLKEVTANQKPGEPWDDALVEDYLNILRDVLTLAEDIDQNAGEIIDAQKRLFAGIQANKVQVSQNRARSFRNRRDIRSLTEDVENIFEFFPVKACSFRIDGNDTFNPSIDHSYNVGSISRNGTGEYTVTLNQGTINGQPIDSRATFSIAHNIQPSPDSDEFRVEVDSFAGNTLSLFVYEVTADGSGPLVYASYDLQASDWVTFNILMNAGSGTLPPA